MTTARSRLFRNGLGNTVYITLKGQFDEVVLSTNSTARGRGEKTGVHERTASVEVFPWRYLLLNFSLYLRL